MTPQEHEQAPSFELPPAQSAEQTGQAQAENNQVARNETQSAVAVEQGISQPMPPIPQQPVNGNNQAQNQTSNSTPSGNNGQQSGGAAASWMPQIADDSDLIEKEWVIKAKEIVARTAHDPHLQNKEMTKFKADYLKKRYNKDINLGDDS